MARRVLNGHRLGALGNEANQTFIRLQPGCRDSIGFQTLGSDQQQLAILQSQIDGANIRDHRRRNKTDDLVQPRACFAFLRHHLAKSVHEQARRG